MARVASVSLEWRCDRKLGGEGAVSRIALSGILGLAVATAMPAFACPGPSAESYMVWYGVPELLPGEVAIEIDIKDAVENRDKRERHNPSFKVKRVLAGAYGDNVVRVARASGGCHHDLAGGAATQLVLVGHVRGFQGVKPVLVARYMKYGDPIHVAAQLAAAKPVTPSP